MLRLFIADKSKLKSLVVKYRKKFKLSFAINKNKNDFFRHIRQTIKIQKYIDFKYAHITVLTFASRQSVYWPNIETHNIILKSIAVKMLNRYILRSPLIIVSLHITNNSKQD